MPYFIIIKGKKSGPYDLSELKQMKLLNDTLTWKEGFDNWMQAKEIEELKDITFSPPPPIPRRKASAVEILKIIFIHLFFGFGFYYVDKTVERKFIYPIFGIYAWFSFANVFLKIIEPLADFHNHNAFGASTIFISWGVTYIVGYIDLFKHFNKMVPVGEEKTNR